MSKEEAFVVGRRFGKTATVHRMLEIELLEMFGLSKEQINEYFEYNYDTTE